MGKLSIGVIFALLLVVGTIYWGNKTNPVEKLQGGWRGFYSSEFLNLRISALYFSNDSIVINRENSIVSTHKWVIRNDLIWIYSDSLPVSIGNYGFIDDRNHLGFKDCYSFFYRDSTYKPYQFKYVKAARAGDHGPGRAWPRDCLPVFRRSGVGLAIAPVGRLDKASEGLLLFTSDPAWAARITDPTEGPLKIYHVQVDVLADDRLLAALQAGVDDQGEWLKASSARLLRHGERNAWLEIVLDEGRNRQIRRLLSAHGVVVLRLLRVAIGALALGDLGKGQWRALTQAEVVALAEPSMPAPH